MGKIRRKLFGHISCLPLRQIEAKPSGEWITRLNIDVMAATALLNQPMHLPHAVVSAVNICVSSMILILMSPGIYGLIIMFVIPHILISYLYIAGPMTRFAMNAHNAAAKNTADMNVLVTCADTAVLYDAQKFLLKRFEESSLELRKANMKILHRRAIESGLLQLPGMCGYLAILLLGGGSIAAGTMTFGELTAAFQYRGGLLKGLMMLLNSLLNIKTALAGVKRVNETMYKTGGLDMEEPLMKIGQIAAFFNVSVKAVRIYEKKASSYLQKDRHRLSILYRGSGADARCSA